MNIMITEVYEAFKEAGASDEKSRTAAQALANYNDCFVRVESQLETIKAELAMVKWIVGGIGFGVLLLVVKSFFPS